MDPNFVQHTLGDVTTRFLGMILYLLGFSVMIYSLIQWLIDTPFFKKRIGAKAGEGNKFWARFDVRPWLSVSLGLFIAWSFHLNFALYLLGLTEPHYVHGIAARAEVTGLANIFQPDMVIFFTEVMTGIAIGAGPKFFIGLSKTFASTRDAVLANINSKKEE
tara:strand:+ start:20 stop:505 length:486 start_codon:yes stop_codon:yes gene_type:complete